MDKEKNNDTTIMAWGVTAVIVISWLAMLNFKLWKSGAWG